MSDRRENSHDYPYNYSLTASSAQYHMKNTTATPPFTEKTATSQRTASCRKVRLPVCDDTKYRNAHIVMPGRFAKFERSLTSLLRVEKSEQLLDRKLPRRLPRSATTFHSNTSFDGERRREYKFTSDKLVAQDCQPGPRPSTTKRAKIRRLRGDRSGLIEFQVAKLLGGQETEAVQSVTERSLQDDALRCIVKRYAATPEEQNFISTLKPRLVTVIAAGSNNPRRSIRIFLNKTSIRSFNQVTRGISDILSPGNPFVQIFSIAQSPVIGLEDFFSSEYIFIGFTEDHLITDEDFTILPQEEKKLVVYKEKSALRNRSKTCKGSSRYGSIY